MANLSFDYAKWDKLEISDDEETFHPNLDNGLNIRVNRITRDRKEDEIDKEKKELLAKGEKAKAAKLEAKRPLHVNNICHVAEERTIIHSSEGTVDKKKKGGESFSYDDYTSFKEDSKKILDEFENASWERSHEMLLTYGDILMNEYANSYYMLTTLDEEMKGNAARVKKLGRQGQILSQIHQLAEPMRRPPRDLIPRFFEKFDHADAQATFQDGVDNFLKHIAARAIAKKKEQEEEEAKEAAEEAAKQQEDLQPVSLVEAMYDMSKEERLKCSPKGIDPLEVFESLPEEMQNCFKSGDVEALKELARRMDPKEFEGHFQKCVDSGLWQSGG